MMSGISGFVKYQRKKVGLTQEQLAQKAGVGIRFIREMEQGKKTLQLNKVQHVLDLFGFQLIPAKQKNDPYDFFWNYLKTAIKITLSDKTIKYGMLVKELIDKKENKIYAWKFVLNKNSIKYLQNPDDTFTEIILHSDIESIENQ